MPGKRRRPAEPLQPAWKREGTVYVVGVDGVTLDLIGPMAEAGELPTFERLAQQGAHGRLETIRPTNSSLLWTSIATGRHHEDHGIDGFQYYTILGWTLTRSTIRRYRRYGIRILESLAKLLRLRKRHYFDGRDIRAKTFWDLVSESGRNAIVVNWWHTWPAAPINGAVVTDRVHYWRSAWRGKDSVDSHLTYPAGLLEEVRDLLIRPDEIDAEQVQRWVNLPVNEIQELIDVPTRTRNPVVEVRFLASADRSYGRIFEHCLERVQEPRLAAVYFRGPDISQHCAFDYMPSSQNSDATDQERDAFGRVVPETYRFADELLSPVVERMSPRDTLFVMSDHGYAAQDDEPGGRRGPYGHALCKPPGVFYAYGQGVARGVTLRDARIYDVAPTVLRALGYPLSQELEGRSLEEAFTHEWRREHPLAETVPTYGPRAARHDTVRMSTETDDTVTEHLRALGYLE